MSFTGSNRGSGDVAGIWPRGSLLLWMTSENFRTGSAEEGVSKDTLEKGDSPTKRKSREQHVRKPEDGGECGLSEESLHHWVPPV